MNKKIVYVDVDDTLADTRGAMVEYYRRFTGDVSTSSDMKTGPKYNALTPLWNTERMIYAFMDSIFFILLKPIPGAVKGINYLIEKGYDVKICTAHRRDGRVLKRAWIRKNFPMVTDIIITEVFEKKDNYVGYAFIDDNIDNLIDNKSDIKVLFDNYGNLDYNNKVVKINKWEEIMEVL